MRASSPESTFASCCSGSPRNSPCPSWSSLESSLPPCQRPEHGLLVPGNMRIVQPEDMVSAAPTERDRLAWPLTDGAGKNSLGVLSTPEPLLRLQRTQRVWQVPELDAQHAKAFLELWPLGSFLVIGQDPSQVLMLKTGPSSGDVNTYPIHKFAGGVSLESSNLCMPDFPHLLAFLSASRDVLPRTLLLPTPPVGPGDKDTDPVRLGCIRVNTSGRVLSVVNQLYLETHGGWGTEQAPQQTEPETDQKHSPDPRKPTPHRVSWVEDPLKPEVHHTGQEVHHLGPDTHHLEVAEYRPGAEVSFPRPALVSVVEEQEEVGSDKHKDGEEGREDLLTDHIRALARARSSYVARQCRCLRARLTSNSGNPYRPGDPATELLQDIRQLLTDLQNYLAKDPDVRAVFGSREPRVPGDEDLGSAVEVALCRAVLEPLKPALWTKLRTLRAQELRLLRRRQIVLRAGAGPEGQHPAPALRSRIHARLAHLHAACVPRRKVALLLAVCSDVYAGLAGGENQEPLGADAFLPALTEELIWSPHIGETQLDVEFLMELLDPEELRGEAGYYLTTWFGALYHIAHYQPDSGRAPQGLSSEARDSLRQWHRRRTLHQQALPTAQANLPFEEPWAVEDQ
ncbi:ras and Rab interactor-like protein isoform X1 [Peromyscus leucopus]|uniref:ras and Rab interactor-like protein isoform X1 n=1 Tax=Peromyscus leucopus TaxID=10041 RepID=UPI001885816C|nr:ras and Rab interactor-like protein isoform X1 [Peromyscus leucopus]